MKLSDLLDTDLLEEMLAGGYVSARMHPEFPLAILNYTDKATYDRTWNDVTRKCRGLIYNCDTDEVVARPFEKFFNYGEPWAPEFKHDDPVEVFDKVDGSLGIIHRQPDGQFAVATRGSFDSEQARWATEFLRRQYSNWESFDNVSTLVEIVYPGNRIVVDYGNIEDLYYLCSIHIPSGESTVAPREFWPGRVVKSFGWMAFADAVSRPPRENAEGLVIRHGERRVKLKQEDYVRLHRIVFGLNARAIWEILASDGDFPSYIQSLPEEFQEWAEECALELRIQHQEWVNDHAWGPYNDIVASLPAAFSRKEFAFRAVEYPNPGPLFLALDGKGDQIRKEGWKAIYPSHRWSPRPPSEEEA